MYLISACLIGDNVKYDGTNNLHIVAKELYDSGQAIPVCPEVFGGLSTPRIPSEIQAGNVIAKDGVDVTDYFQRGAKRTLEIAKEHGIQYAILQERSPSCGVHEIYDGSFTGAKIAGSGITTSLLREHGITVITIEDYVRDHHETDQ